MALVNPNIAMSYRGIELPQQNALADYAAIQQIQGGRQAQELNALKMQEAQRKAKSQNVLADAYAQATDPATGKIDYNKLTGLVAAGGGGAQLPGIQKLRTEQSAAETKLQRDQADLLDSKLKQSRSFLDTLDPSDPDAPDRYIAWHEANHKDPIIGAALTARGVTADQSRAQIMAAIAKGPAAFAQLLNQSKLGTEKFMEMNKPTTQVVDQSGQRQVLQFPGLGGAGTSVGTYPDMPLPKAVEEQQLRLKKAGAASTSINVGTEKKYGEKLAGNIADRDDAKLGAAEKAPQLAESANRIIDLVKQGNVFTGPIADIKLNVARGLNVLGASNEEKIANTELLIAATGQSTLDAIKSAGLGTGQGFTDKDLNFLRGIAGGKIDFRPETLTELARLQHLAATRSVQAWNTRFKDIPKSSIEGMGLRTAPDVPPLSPSAIFAKNPKTGERIQSLDGGNTWKPVGGK